jgi:hypothetical protein
MNGVAMSSTWEEIHGFSSPGEYDRFVRYIEQQVTAGLAREVETNPLYGKGMIFGGRWFEDAETKDVWRLVAGRNAPFTAKLRHQLTFASRLYSFRRITS